MGEGNEQTPIAIIQDLPLIIFQQRNPTAEELAELSPQMEDDIFAPFLTKASWKHNNLL